MTLTGIASRYALALVDAVTAFGSDLHPEQAQADLDAFAAAMSEARDLDLILLSPAVSPQRKRAVIRRLTERMQMSRLVSNFILVLSDHRRLGQLKEVRESFVLHLDQRLGFQRATVTAAAPLSESEQNEIAARLEQVTGKHIRMHVEIDPELIGGVVARVGSTVYDGSVLGHLRALEQRLTTEAR